MKKSLENSPSTTQIGNTPIKTPFYRTKSNLEILKENNLTSNLYIFLSSKLERQTNPKPFVFFYFTHQNVLKHRRYKILCINLLKDVAKPEVAAQIILTHLQMPEENYRLGKTKVYCFNLMDRWKAVTLRLKLISIFKISHSFWN